MKRTITQVIEMIKEKIDNCERNEYALRDAREMGLLDKSEKEKINELSGVKQTYIDILALLESSHLVEQEKAFEIFKKYLKINITEEQTIWNKDYCVTITPKPDAIGDIYSTIFVTEEEKEIIGDCLND